MGTGWSKNIPTFRYRVFSFYIKLKQETWGFQTLIYFTAFIVAVKIERSTKVKIKSCDRGNCICNNMTVHPVGG